MKMKWPPLSRAVSRAGPARIDVTLPAYDLTVRLVGAQIVTQTFDGYANGHFSARLLGGFINNHNSFITWQDFFDGTDTTIDPNEGIHVGWSTTTPATSANIRDMYWTDAQHNRIPGNIVCNCTPQFTYSAANGIAHVTWGNGMSPDPGIAAPTVHIDQVYFALVDQPLPLSTLNQQNTQLGSLLQQWIGPAGGPIAFDLQPNATVSFDIPVAAAPSQHVVLRYGANCQNGSASARDFVQSDQLVLPSVPAQKPWHLVGLLMLLGAIGTFLLVKRGAAHA